MVGARKEAILEMAKGASNESGKAEFYSLLQSLVTLKAMRCMVELGIADILRDIGRPATVNEIAESPSLAPGVDVGLLGRIMRFLTSKNIFQKVEGGRYALTPVSQFLVSGTELDSRALVLLNDLVAFNHAWSGMAEYIRSGGGGQSLFSLRHDGEPLHTRLARSPAEFEIFHDAMADNSRVVTSDVIKGCGDAFEGLSSLVDVGGGTGTAIRAIADAFPHLKCTLFDLPSVVAKVTVQHERVTLVAGNMLESVFPSADAVLLMNVLHDWSDEVCVNILKRCKEAIRPEGGKVIIVDGVIDEENPEGEFENNKLGLDLIIMMATGGIIRTVREWQKLLADADFSRHSITHIATQQSVIQAFP